MSDSSALFNHSGLASTLYGTPGNNDDYASSGVSVLDTPESDNPSDFDLCVSINSLFVSEFFIRFLTSSSSHCSLILICMQNLQFGSQDSTLYWMDKL